MKLPLRTALFVASGAIFTGALLGAALQLPTFGHRQIPYAAWLNARAPIERAVANVPTAITFDYRGLDTLGEEFILFGALIGLAQVITTGKRHVIATHEDDEQKHVVPADRGEAIRVFALASLGGVLVIAIDIITHGHLSPGSGFQGGVLASAAWLMIYLGFGADIYCRFARGPVVEGIEALGAAAYVVIGCIGVIDGTAFLANALPRGHFRQLLSGGTITAINLAVGLEVASGFVLAYGHLLDVARTRPSLGAEP